jgi:hypothetical protein
VGALVSAVSPNLGVLIPGNSVFEGVGTALLIPPQGEPLTRTRLRTERITARPCFGRLIGCTRFADVLRQRTST